MNLPMWQRSNGIVWIWSHLVFEDLCDNLTVFKLTFKEGAVAKEVSVKKKLEDEVKVCS